MALQMFLKLNSPISASENKDKETERLVFLKGLILGLSTLEGVGWKTVRSVFQSYISEGDRIFVSERLVDILQKRKIPGYKNLAEKMVSNVNKIVEKGLEEYETLKQNGIDLLVENELPDFVNTVNGEKPLWLFIKGNRNILFSRSHISVGIVGTRNMSQEARDHIKRLVWLLSRYPVVVVSGLAEGIDSWAHNMSIDLNMKNVAFLGHGIYISTSKNSEILKQKIVEKEGVIVSEYFPKERYSKEKFLRRNRLIAGFSDIVIPVQANVPGGTYSTVLHALKGKKQIVGIEMKNSSIVDFLRKQGCLILNTEQASDLVLFDKLLKDKLARKGITFDSLSVFKEKIKKLFDTEIFYRYKDEEFCNEMRAFLIELMEYISKKMEDRKCG